MNEHSQVTGIFQCLAHSICFNPHPEKKRARITKKTLKGPPMTRWHSTLHVRMIFLTNLSIQLASERFQHLASKWLNHPSTVWWATHDTLSWRDVTKSNRPKLTRGALCDIFSCDYSAFFSYLFKYLIGLENVGWARAAPTRLTSKDITSEIDK